MKKHFFKGIAIAIAVAISVPAVPISTQAAAKISISSCVISKGDKIDLDIKGINENSGKYSTSMKAVASVTKNGIVTAKKAGNAKITWKKGKKKYTCNVKVVKAPVLSKSKLEIREKQKETITVQKYGNKKLTVKWSSSDKKIAKVSDGKITGLSEGETTIKAKIKGYKKTWTRELKVIVNKKSAEATKEPDVTAVPESTQIPDVTTAPVMPDISASPATPAPTTKPTLIPTTTPTLVPTPAPQATETPASPTPPTIWYPVIKPAAGENLIKNGDFTRGEEGWNIHSITSPGEATAEVKDGKVVYNITNVGNEDWNIQLKQENIALEKGCNYKMTFNAASTEARTIKLAMLSNDGQYTWYGGADIILEKDLEKNVEIKFTMDYPTDLKTTLAVSMGQIKDYETKEDIPTPASTITLSDFKLVKIDASDVTPVPDTTPAPDATQTPDVTQTPDTPADGNLIKNGDFAKGEEGWNIKFITSPGEATAEVKDGKVVYNIANVGTEDWHVQLKQENITLEKDCNYKMTFNATSTEARTIKLAMLSNDGQYTWYGGKDIALEKDLEENVEIKFTMNYPTDIKTTLAVSMGQIKDENTKENIPTPASTITLSDFKLVKIDAPEATPTPVPDTTPTPDVPNTPADGNLIKNGNFANGTEGWDIQAITAPGEATVEVKDGKIVYNITNVGDDEWYVQLKQVGITLEQGCKYKVTFKVTSTETRKIKFAMSNNDDNNYKWYGGADIDLTKDSEENFETEFTMDESTDSNTRMVVSMGKMDNKDTPVSTITLSDFTLVKIDIPENGNLIKNGNFANGTEEWDIQAITAPGEATVEVKDGKIVYNITNVGDDEWYVQLKQVGITLEQGCKYKVTFKVTSTETRKIKFAMSNNDDNNYKWYGGADIDLTKDSEENFETEFTMDESTDSNTRMVVSMGKMDNKDTPVSTITLSDFTLVKVE